MTIQECYAAMGGNYEEVLGRLISENLISRMIAKFLQDDSYSKLSAAIEENNCEEAFRAAHTLKGICQNLGLGALETPAVEITEALRGKTQLPENVGTLMQAVDSVYEVTKGAILEFI